MPESDPQAYTSHRRYDPLFHFVLVGILSVNIIVAAVGIFRAPSFGTIWGFLMALALGILAWKVREYPLTAQDRVIRLEERIRLERLLPPDLKARIGELRERQLVGLRFASDGEVADRVREALDQKLGGEEIKKRITNWRPDDFRV